MRNETGARSATDASTAEPLSWAPGVQARYVTMDGTRIRYVATGSGPPLVLLHTLRTQLDMFQKVIPELARRFRLLALDYPGHGRSDAPDADYGADFLVASVAAVLERLDVRDALVVGESIGGSIALRLAGRHDPRVRRVVAVNPYDYDRGRGLRRSSTLANAVFALTAVPVVGELPMRYGTYDVLRRIMEGGVYRATAFPPGLLRELYESGRRPGHPRAFAQLVRHWGSWARGREAYGSVEVPVLLVYGDHDWSRGEEREADRRAIPGARMRVVEHAGHFLSLDAPDELVRAVVEHAS